MGLPRPLRYTKTVKVDSVHWTRVMAPTCLLHGEVNLEAWA
jgi:hypothetical protein